jgi:large conductance mechanosensitive channel
MLREFKDFAVRGNVMDLAVGVVIGAAFNSIVTSLVGDVFMPLIGVLTGGMDFSGLNYQFGAAHITYGKFLQSIFIFLITAFALFLLIKAINRLKRKNAEPPELTVPADVQLLTEIRDLLKSRQTGA